jgi:hypothetical protein
MNTMPPPEVAREGPRMVPEPAYSAMTGPNAAVREWVGEVSRL